MPAGRLWHVNLLHRIEAQRAVACSSRLQSVCFSQRPPQIKTTQAEACATGPPGNSSDKCELKGARIAATQVGENVVRFVGRAFRHDNKGFLSSGVLTPERLKTFLSSVLGIHRERFALIRKYQNICESKHPFGRAEEENPHPSQKSEGLRHQKLNPPQSRAHTPLRDEMRRYQANELA